mmetsp:Transcript_4096/g.7571  ORF Transcript_4096/g.7571 Transcript_4096/m.7571 type:complete len:192 (-) Transcript_4096:148-723(-)
MNLRRTIQQTMASKPSVRAALAGTLAVFVLILLAGSRVPSAEMTLSTGMNLRRIHRLRGGEGHMDPTAIKNALDSAAQNSGNPALMEKLQQNPQLISQFSQIMSDPEVQGLMLKPGLIQKMEQFMAKGAKLDANSDPDIVKLSQLMVKKMKGIPGMPSLPDALTPPAPEKEKKDSPPAPAAKTEEDAQLVN